MRTFPKIIVSSLALLLLAVLVAGVALRTHPPDLLRVGANYAAKMICSNVFLAGRDPADVLRLDVQAPGNPLLRVIQAPVDTSRRLVHADLFGFIGGGLAAARPGVGCAALPDGRFAGKADTADAPARGSGGADQPWPDGDAVATDAAVNALLNDARLTGPGVRGVVVIHQGRLVGERYADGFTAHTPQLGWSMTKSVTAGLLGLLVKDGTLALDQPGPWPADDPRAKITVADLLSMTSGLEWNEAYGAVSDVTRMLYLESDMADFARAKPLASPPGTVWNYSSGTANILARLFQDTAGPDAIALVRRRLFDPLGMASAVIETDEHGTLVGSSYMYATARDWGRYGLLLAQDGVWSGRRILPDGYVAMMSTPVPASGGEYAKGLVWKYATHPETPGANPNTEFGLPADTFWMSGHDGQYVAILPSRRLVVVRLGLTPATLHYRPEPLVEALLATLP